MRKANYLYVHIACWLILLSSNVYDSYGSPIFSDMIIKTGLSPLVYNTIFNGAYLLDFMIAFYGAYFLIAPYLFFRRRYLVAAGFTIVVLAGIVAGRYIAEFGINLPFLKFNNYFDHHVKLWPYAKNCILYTYRYSLFGLVVYFIQHSKRLENEKKEIDKAKAEAELAFLKSQINPHFLFNTINDIYALVYQKSDQAPAALLKLTSLLRYMLRESSAESVHLKNEIEYMRDYIELQHIGYKGQIHVDFEVRGQVDGQQIAPLVLIPFVENIFKHGVIDDAQCPPKLYLNVQESQLSMRTSNKIKNQQKDSLGGIGLNNVKKRLELSYPGNYSFSSTVKEDEFSCQLEVNLDGVNPRLKKIRMS